MKKAFTLVEVMIVVAVIAILASLAIPNFIAYRKAAHNKACLENIEIIKSACRTYMINHGGTYTEDQAVLVGNTGTGVLRKEVKCPIGGEYTIKYDSSTGEFKVTCSHETDDE